MAVAAILLEPAATWGGGHFTQGGPCRKGPRYFRITGLILKAGNRQARPVVREAVIETTLAESIQSAPTANGNPAWGSGQRLCR